MIVFVIILVLVILALLAYLGNIMFFKSSSQPRSDISQLLEKVV
jgi:alpha-N-acetylglucosamine transferase